MKIAILSIVASFLPILALSQPELKGSPNELKQFLYPNDKIVMLFGEAEEKAYSDRAIISVVVETEAKLLSESIARNSELRSSLTKQLINAGMSSDNIKSSKFASSPQYGWFGKKPNAFKVVNRIAVTVDNEKHLEAVAVACDQSEEARLSDTTFEHSAKEETKQAVKAKALDKIMRQKAFYEKSLGIKLEPIGVRDSNIRYQPTRGARQRGAIEEVMVQADQSAVSNLKSYSQPKQASFDEVKYTAALSVEFRIAD